MQLTNTHSPGSVQRVVVPPAISSLPPTSTTTTPPSAWLISVPLLASSLPPFPPCRHFPDLTAGMSAWARRSRSVFIMTKESAGGMSSAACLYSRKNTIASCMSSEYVSRLSLLVWGLHRGHWYGESCLEFKIDTEKVDVSRNVVKQHEAKTFIGRDMGFFFLLLIFVLCLHHI